jgi:adenylate cyclase class 2
MHEEIEAKVRIASPEALRRRMAERGMPGGGTVFEVNRLFDDAAGSLRRKGSALRLREERRPGDGAVVRTVLTFKGPRTESRMKRRPEFEVTVEAADPLVAILESLGLSEAFRYEKRRTTWHAGACEVVLDEVPHLGWFAEVEGPTEEAVLAVLADLGLGDEPILRHSYIRLLSDHLASRGLDPARAVFGP